MATRRDILKGVCGLAVLALAPVVLAEDAEAAHGLSRLGERR